MKSPCEAIVWNVLPGIRAALASELLKRGLSQYEASMLLGITPSAVSQYLSKKRGCNIEFSDEVKAAISALAEEIIQRRIDDLSDGICVICMMLREEGTACRASPIKEDKGKQD
jgi:predicted transcriptional regulator